MKQADQNINTKQMTDDEAEEVFFAWELTSRGREEARHHPVATRKFFQKHRGNLRKAYLNQRLGKKKGA